MRVLASVIPAHGHLNPMVPMLRALVDAGHDVRVATSASFCARVAEAGLEAVPAGLDWLESAPEQVFPDSGPILDPRMRSQLLGRIMFSEGPIAMVRDLARLCDDWRPDVVLGEPTEFGAHFVAELRGIPLVCLRYMIALGTWVGSAPLDAAKRRGMRNHGGLAAFNALRASLNLKPLDHDELAPVTRGLVLDPNPASLHAWHATTSSRFAHPLRPVPYNAPGPEPAWPTAAGPKIHISLGTVFAGDRSVVRETVAGVTGLGSVLVGSSDETLDRPGQVAVAAWIDHTKVAPQSDLFVTHGGWGTMIAALCHGVPQLVVPQGADQFPNALRLRSIGAGDFIGPGDLDADAVRAAATRIINDPLYRLNAERIRGEIEAMPAPSEQVVLVERFVASGGRPMPAPPPFGLPRAPTAAPPAAQEQANARGWTLKLPSGFSGDRVDPVSDHP